ncbi:MAG TPA: molybdopterin-dependent oxidoreductase [Acidimicrobiales bacterium]|nr:molybdopterin-dependent oxidoreductase [Acidimicrobiales bacterium]
MRPTPDVATERTTVTAPPSSQRRAVLGTCHHDCPDSCGWVVTVEDQPECTPSGPTAVRLRGNPDHPYSRGELCPKVNRFLDRVYSPDRLLRPLVRRGSSGNKGQGDFAPVSWDEALALVAERLGEIVRRHGGEAVLPWWSAGTQGLIQQSSLDRRFFAKLGASRLTGSLCGAVAGAGTASTNGSGRAADPTDVRFARLVLLWGTNTRLTNRHLWPFVEEARGNGATIVVIDPMRTMTAESADWFVQPLPGTDVALMLGMMHVLIRDDLVDHDYVERHTVGFERLAELVREWSPARVAEVCGLGTDEVERLGGAYGTTTPAFIRTLIGAEHQEHGAMFFRALACLPALTGAWRHRGGGLARSVGAWAETNVDESVFDAPPPGPPKARRAVNMNHLGRALTDPAMDPPVKALFVWNGNPLVSVPNAELTRRGLAREDLFTVASEQFLTDTARFADVIFPAATQIEQTDVVASWGHLYLGWNAAAIPPLGEAVPNTELWRRLARAMGFTEPELFEDDESLLRSALHDVDLDALRERGFVRLSLPEDLRPYADGGFATASGRAELYSDALAARGHDPLPAFRPPGEGVGGDDELTGRYPLVLMTPKTHTRFLNTSYSHLPKHGPPEGGPFAELDPTDATTRGIAEGDTVRVWNDRGSLTLTARVGARLRPGVVAVPFGWWSDQHGERGTANSLTNDTLTDWGGGVAYGSTRVEVEAVRDETEPATA